MMPRVIVVLPLLLGAAAGAQVFPVSPRPLERTLLVRASVDTLGRELTSFVHSTALSPDGRFVAFGNASSLVPADTNGETDIYVRDLSNGDVFLVSVSTSGELGDFESAGTVSLSEGARRIAFASRAANLVNDDTNGVQDVFVHDRKSGVTSRVSVSSNRSEADAISFLPSLSSDGRFVSFSSSATNLVDGDTNGVDDIFVHSLETGETVRVSVGSAGRQGNGASYHPSISRDGRFVAFTSRADNLVALDTNGPGPSGIDVFLFDRLRATTERISLDGAGQQANGSSTYPSITPDGRFVVFASQADNLVPGDENGFGDIFIRDRQLGSTERVSVSQLGQEGNGSSYSASVSANGKRVAFASVADDLTGPDTNRCADIFVRDIRRGTTQRVSRSVTGEEANDLTHESWISADGKVVSFLSFATNLIFHDGNQNSDLFVRSWPKRGLR